MKKFRYFLLIVFVLPVCFLCFGCTEKVTVVDIEKTSIGTGYEIYTIHYSNGKTSTITVNPGENGKDGKDLNLDQLFEYCVQCGLYENDAEGRKQFIADYIANRVGTQNNIYNSMNSSVVVNAAFKQMSGTYAISGGSGVIWQMGETTSYIVTNCHVVANYVSVAEFKLPEKIMVYQYGADIIANYSSNHKSYYFSGGIFATCVGYSADYDLAVLKVNTSELLDFNENACAVDVADKYYLAENVYAIGNSMGEGFSVSKGIVSKVSEVIPIYEFPLDNKGREFRVMRIDVPIYSGNSGGGLFNEQGKLVGIVNAGADIGDNYNYALPIDNVKNVVKSLIYYHEIGSNAYDSNYLTMADLGVVVSQVYDNYNTLTGELTYVVEVNRFNLSYLKDRGLEVGDVFKEIKVDNQKFEITRDFQLNDALILARENSNVSFVVDRSGQSLTIYVPYDLLNQLLNK